MKRHLQFWNFLSVLLLPAAPLPSPLPPPLFSFPPLVSQWVLNIISHGGDRNGSQQRCCVWAVSVGICCWCLPGWEWWGRRCVLIRGHVAPAPFTRFLSELDCLLWLPPAFLVPWDGIWPSQGLGASPLGTGAGNCWWGSRPCHRPREAVVLASLTHSEPGHVAHTHLGFENQVSGRTWLSSLVWFLHCFFFFFIFS